MGNKDVNAGAESFYFTKSGQQSRFTNAKQKQYEDDMDDVLMGGCENDDDSKSDDTDSPTAINAVIKLRQHQHVSPCLIVSLPNKNQSKYCIEMPAPFRAETYWVHPEQFTIVYDNEKYVKKVEKNWEYNHQTPLG